MKYHLLFILLASFSIIGCLKCPDGVPDPSCICPAIYEPVCGCDNVTYGNSCQALCAGIDEYKDGECF